MTQVRSQEDGHARQGAGVTLLGGQHDGKATLSTTCPENGFICCASLTWSIVCSKAANIRQPPLLAGRCTRPSQGADALHDGEGRPGDADVAGKTARGGGRDRQTAAETDTDLLPSEPVCFESVQPKERKGSSCKSPGSIKAENTAVSSVFAGGAST